ncbi:MAG TPA: hypothetical protein VIV60_30365, partial [Polyangiaceae bacterium]
GALAALSKESGALLFVLHFAAYIVIFAARAPNSIQRKRVALTRYALALGAPLALLAGLGLVYASKHDVSLWSSVDPMTLVRQFSTISFLDNVLLASLATIFVLNCMWLPTLVLAAAFTYWAVRRFILALSTPVSRDPAFELVVAVFVIDVLLLTRFRTFTNVRYYMPAFPAILLLAARALLALQLPRWMRRFGQTMVFLALGFSNLRSFDPVSDRVFGTMRFGDHRLFRITSLTGECCGLGRDQLVYNLEFAEIEWLLRQVFPFVLAHADEYAIAAHPEADWRFFDSIDPASLRRATPTKQSTRVPNTHSWAVAAAPVKPRKIYYIALPNMADCNEFTKLGTWYKFQWRAQEFEHNGYRIDLHELTLK